MWGCSAEVLVSIVGIPADAALGATFRVGDLGGHGELFGHEFRGYLVHGVHRYRQPVRLLAMEPNQVVTEQGRVFSCRKKMVYNSIGDHTMQLCKKYAHVRIKNKDRKKYKTRSS